MKQRFLLPTPMALAATVLLACSAGPALAVPSTYGPGPGGSMPDANLAGLNSTITVVDAGTVTSFTSVTIFGLTHTFMGDLIVTLTHGGVSIDLLDRVIGDGNATFGDRSNLSGDYTFLLGGADINAAAAGLGDGDAVPSGSYAPHSAGATGGFLGASSPFTQTLADLAGAALAGDWVLRVSDSAGGDVGAFTSWSFTVDRAAGATNVPEPSSIALAALAAALLSRGSRAAVARHP